MIRMATGIFFYTHFLSITSSWVEMFLNTFLEKKFYLYESPSGEVYAWLLLLILFLILFENNETNRFESFIMHIPHINELFYHILLINLREVGAAKRLTIDPPYSSYLCRSGNAKNPAKFCVI